MKLTLTRPPKSNPSVLPSQTLGIEIMEGTRPRDMVDIRSFIQKQSVGEQHLLERRSKPNRTLSEPTCLLSSSRKSVWRVPLREYENSSH